MIAIKNNKGISLVDLIIAIAVLALLIGPIVLHTMTTLNTSAQAKEKQYAIDSATAVMEYFNQSSIEDIKTNKNVKDIVNVSSVVYHKVGKPAGDPEEPIRCYIYVNGVANGDYIDYNATDFIIDKTQPLGRNNTEYTRAVVMTDLANRLLAGKSNDGKRYRINYSINEGDSLYTKLKGKPTTLGDFDILSNHSAVVYDGDDNTRHIVCVDCIEATDNYIDPNDVSLGNIQNLDADTLAIIEGDAANLDYKFESDLVSKILDYFIRRGDYTEEEKEEILHNLDGTNGLNSKISAIIDSTGNTFRRMFYISVLRRTNAHGEEYYNVVCDVTYYAHFSDEKYNIFNGNHTGQFTYNIMDKDFYTKTPPDVYMAYEPFVINSTGTTVNYAYDEDFVINCDKYTSGTAVNGSGEKYDRSKIYIIRPTKTWQTESHKDEGAYPTSDMYYTYKNGNYNTPVKIHVNQILKNGDTEDNQQPLQVITNLNVNDYKENDSLNRQYYISYVNDTKSLSTGSDHSTEHNNLLLQVPKYKKDRYLTSDQGTRIAYKKTIKDKYGDDVDSIVSLSDDPNYNGKLYNITVNYESPSGEKIYLTGAKGAD